MWGWLSSIADSITALKESILSLPGLVVDGIREVFVPDTEEIEDVFIQMTDNVQQNLGFNVDSLMFLKDSISESEVEDVYGDYNILGIGSLNLKFLDTEALVQAVEYFRPILRGFTALMLLLYNYRQVLSFIGQEGAISAGLANKSISNKEGKD